MPTDEGPHDATEQSNWVEAWLFDVVQVDGSIALSIELLIWPQHNRAAFHASVVQTGAPLISLVELDAVAPKPPGLEIRASGLWADIGIQTALDHVTVDIESFAVQLDDPTDVFHGAYGIRTALGCELEWETDAELIAGPTINSYEVPCIVHGELLLDDRRIEIDGWGWRSHRWGVAAAGDRSESRGRQADGRWLNARSTRHATTLSVMAEAPVPDPSLDVPLWQSLVRSDTGDLVWVRRTETP